MVNDIVSIILFNTVKNLVGKEFTNWTPVIILAEFIMLGVISLSVGFIVGGITCLTFKHFRFIVHNPITEVFVMMCMSWSCYFISELIVIDGIAMSGLISLLTCGIMQAHYTWYNLSPNGKNATTIVFNCLGVVSEAAVYSYVGLAFYSVVDTWWSWEFIAIETAIIILGRLFCVTTTFYLFRLCFRKKTIVFRELMFIAYAGTIRGAIAFALVLKICENDEAIVNDIN